MCQNQADQLGQGRPALQLKKQQMCNHNQHQEVISDIHAKGGAKWQQSQAGRPGRDQPASNLHVT
jgi:hypothetical protein